MKRTANNSAGIVLISTLFMIVALLALIAAYFSITQIELATTKSTSNSAEGFFAAEAALNLRADDIRTLFLGYNRPQGHSPNPTNACTAGNTGDGDFLCKTKTIGKHESWSYINEDPSNPITTTIPPGELYQNLNAQEYRYTVRSTAYNINERVEAILDLRFKSRLVPLFQFVAFYNKDLEIAPGPAMTLNGPIHTNGDLYLNADNSLNITGQVSTAKKLYRGRKNNNVCGNTVSIRNPTALAQLVSGCTARTERTSNQVTAWNGMIRIGVDAVTVPEPEILDPVEGNTYWDLADLRLVLNLNSSGNPVTTYSVTGVEVRNTNDTVNTTATTFLHGCTGSISGRPVGTTTTFKNFRESTTQSIRMLEVDMQALFNCIHTSGTGSNSVLSGRALNDTTEGGLVFHMTVKGPNSAAAQSRYGVRVRNGTTLQSNNGGATVKGLTIVTDQGFYVRGHYNSTNKIPAAFLTDTFNVLSNNWNFGTESTFSSANFTNRTPTATTVNAAVLAATDVTGGIEGSGGQGGAYNGGLENYPRFHENWTGVTFTYLGSFVSLNTPRHSTGAWVYGLPQYNAPTRVWSYDTDFNDAAKLPPLSPRFVYLRQELFVRDFEQDG